ncbi:hypothetical protein BU16DRAFT_253369 [Lophium mytilinum]|uniref:AB hydrolase-1 domain-containing protein n=1 Tax=Lophium mytilinum TaxID=390894 RepID=A0A6A6R9Y9_9PEZI|nr:hypothetical protein BU16DRAFT_253369 [Lophium mytilinum]
MMEDSTGKPPDERAIEFLCDIRFHKSIVLPPDPTKGRLNPLRVSYSDYGYHDPLHPESEAVVLFCGPLMGGRIAYAQLDSLLKRHRVRIIHPDRPGIGGSDPVKLQNRISTWLDLVPYLLNHLSIPHVSLASHSGGCIYLFNTLLALPHILHPSTPYLALFAPWVHYSHTNNTSLALTKYLPTAAVGKFGALARFVNNNLTPVVGYSGSLLNQLKHQSPVAPPAAAATSATSGLDDAAAAGPTADAALFTKALSSTALTYIFAEASNGFSEDAKLFLHKGAHTAWSCPDATTGAPAWTDTDGFVPLLCAQVFLNSITGALAVDVFHAASDNMVGEKGQKWFDECWDAERWPQGVRERMSYRSQVGPVGTDHNFLIGEEWGLSEEWAGRVRESFPV